jgi:hypothetical protein
VLGSWSVRQTDLSIAQLVQAVRKFTGKDQAGTKNDLIDCQDEGGD